MPAQTSDWGPSLWIGGIVFLVMSPALFCDLLRLWDDQLYVINNPVIRSWSLQNLKDAFTTFFVGNYAPVQILSYTLDYSLWGLNPFGYHLTNILLHALNAALVFVLFRWLGVGRITAAFAALIFGIHPAQVESVAWISQRKNVLAMTWTMASLLLYIRVRTSGHRWPRLVSIICFGLAMLTKSAAIGLPLILIAADVSMLNAKFGPCRRSVYVPYFVIAVVTAIVTVLAQRGGGLVPYYGGSLGSTAMTMSGVMLDYARILLFPIGLSGVYKPPIAGGLDLRVVTGFALFIGFLVRAFWSWREGRAEILFWTVWIVATLLPVSQIISINAIMADRYLYFPMVGVAILTASCLGPGSGRIVPRMIAGILLAVFCALTIDRIPVWRNDFIFWEDNARKTPSDPQSHVNYGYLLSERHKDAEAIREYQAALRANETYFLAHNGLAWIYLTAEDHRLRNVPEGWKHARRAMELSGGAFPEIVDTWITALTETGQRDEAERVLEEAVRRFPGNSLFIHSPDRSDPGS